MEEVHPYTRYIQEESPSILKNLKSDQKPGFGVMTPQHMVEHLIKTVKFSMKTYGEIPEKPNESQEKFKKFIFSDAEFRQSDPAKAKLDDLKFANLEEAITAFPEAIQKFYSFFEENPEVQPYNEFFGALTKEEIERFHYKHFRHHFKQFGLI